MRHHLLLFLLMLLSLRTYGETEQYYNSLVGSQIKAGTSVSVAESHFGNYNGTLYDVASSVGGSRSGSD